MTRKMKSFYPEIDYKAQLGISLTYIYKMLEEKKAKIARRPKTYTVNELVDMSWEDIDGLSIEVLKRSDYGIKYFDLGAEYTEERAAKLERLRERLKAAEAPRARRSVVSEVVRADCGHMVEKHELMSASMGTSCPGCYDRMSA